MDKSVADINSPVQRNSVRRNLNKSFDTNPSETSDSILKYTNVRYEDFENPQLSGDSEYNKKPFVLLQNLLKTDLSPRVEEKDVNTTPLRKSTRKVQRKSYADYISPVKRTSKKEKCKSSNSESQDFITDLNRTQIKCETPKKYLDEVHRSQKETVNYRSSISTPRSIVSKIKENITPKRNEKRKILLADTVEELDHISPSKKQTPRSRKQTSTFLQRKEKSLNNVMMTPSHLSRNKITACDGTPLSKARNQLHVSYVPKALPCREKEYCDIFNFLEGKLLDGSGGCMYISGVPGTGKTATVTSVIRNLQQTDDVTKFSYICINGMRLTEPRHSYVEILKQLSGRTVPWVQAQTILEEQFTKKSKNINPVVMLIDELDILCTKRQDVVYNLLDWPTKAKNQLIVITIANTMDLPERLLMNRVTSRLGLTRLTFQAYTHKQLQEIVTKRISGMDCFNADAIQLVARKVASVSGDARRALDICRRAAEIAESEGNGQLVNMDHVNKVLIAMITQPKMKAIKNCSKLEQLILQSIVAEVERTGVEETNFVDVFKMLVSCATIEGFKMVSSTNALAAVSRLSAYKLILTNPKCNDISQKIILNVSIDDIYYSLKRGSV